MVISGNPPPRSGQELFETELMRSLLPAKTSRENRSESQFFVLNKVSRLPKLAGIASFFPEPVEVSPFRPKFEDRPGECTLGSTMAR